MSPLRPLLRLPWLAPLLAAYPALHIAARNPGQVAAADLGVAIAVAVTAALALVGALRLARASPSHAAVAAALVVAAFFAFGFVHAHLELTLRDAVEAGSRAAKPMLLGLSPGLTLVFLAGLAWSIRRLHAANPERLARLAAAANVAALALVALSLPRVHAALGAGATPAARASTTSVGTAAASPRPDVYYIVLDGYARADVLARHYGFDNTPFLGALRARGFDVAESALANYGWTFLSLASSLNLDYLPAVLGAGLDPQSTDRTRAYDAIRDNETARRLRRHGYRFVHLQSTWGATASNRHADQFVPCRAGPFDGEFFRALVEASWLRVFTAQLTIDLASCHLANLQWLRGAASEPGPKFVFAHFLPPHHPYLFRRDGQVRRDAVVANQFEFQDHLWADKAQYLEQLEFMNREVLAVVDALRADPRTEPIIILQSDHGPQLVAEGNPSTRRLARFAILAAALLPGQPAGALPGDVAAVNVLRLVLDRYFGEPLPPLPARHFRSAFDRPFDLEPVPAEQLR